MTKKKTGWIFKLLLLALLSVFTLSSTGVFAQAASKNDTSDQPQVIWGGNNAHVAPYFSAGFTHVEEQPNQIGQKLAVRYFANYPSGCRQKQSCPSHKYDAVFAPNSEETNLFKGGRLISMSVSNTYTFAAVANGYTRKGNSGQTIAKEYSDMFDRMLNLHFGINGAPNEVWFTFNHEMNLGDTTGEESSQNFQLAWRFLYNLYKQRVQATGKPDRVKFVLISTNSMYNYGDPSAWWPGDQYVDIIGSDLYNKFGKAKDSRSFQQIFEGNGGPNALPNWAAAHGNKPIAFTEIGTRGNTQQAKQWWIDLGNYAATHHQIIAFFPFTGGDHWSISKAYDPLQHQGVMQAIAATNGNAVSYNWNYTPTPPSGMPDLIVTSVTPSIDHPKPGNRVTFSATIMNQGTGAVPYNPDLGIAFAIDGNEVSWNNFPGLAPGASMTVTGSYSDSGSPKWKATRGMHTLTAIVDDTNLVAESNEDNNTLSIPLKVAR
jgi:beta-mannanase